MKMKTTLTVLLIMEVLGLSSALFKQHFYVNEEKTWYSARSYCKYFYNDLSSFINNTEEQQFLVDAVDQSSDAWIGLFKTRNTWAWVGGKIATQISWDTAMNQPDKNNEECGFLYKSSKKIHNGKCQVKQPFFCMVTSAVAPLVESWAGALEYCRENYNDLASLSSSNKVNLALGTIAQANTEYVWAGLRFLAGEWRWISGDDFDVDQSMKLSQCPPTNLRCGALNKQTKVWTPIDCEEKLSFICQ